jgi:sugar/nucleoside kinase (ribokinase family)
MVIIMLHGLSHKSQIPESLIALVHSVVTMGAQGALLVSRFDDDEPTMQHFPPYEGVIVRNATGAGDSFTGATVHSLLQKNRMAAAVEAGMKAAVVSLECADRAIPTEIGD